VSIAGLRKMSQRRACMALAMTAARTREPVRALLLGAILGAFVALDPFVTTHLLPDFPWLRKLPYLLSLTVALSAGAAFAARRFVVRLGTSMIHDYQRWFPLLLLFAYQFTGVRSGHFDATELVIGVFALLYLVGLFIRPDQCFVSTPFNMLQLAFAMCLTLSLVSQFKPVAYFHAFKPLVVFFLLVNFLPREDVIGPFLRWLIVLGILSAAFGLVQELAWMAGRVFLSVLPEQELEGAFETFFGVRIFRIPAMTESYRVLAQYLATAILLSLSALLWGKVGTLLRRRWLVLGLFVMIPALALTLAGDILIGSVLAFVLALLMRWPTRLVPVALMAGLAGVLALLTAVAVVPGHIDTAVELARTIPKSEEERIRLDRDSIEGFLHGPYFWTGRGVGSGDRYTAHSRHWPAHNTFILVAAELGVFGLVVLTLIYGLAVARVLEANVLVTSGPLLPVVRSLLPIMVVVLIGAQFTAAYLEEFVWTIFALIEAVTYLARVERPSQVGTGVLA